MKITEAIRKSAITYILSAIFGVLGILIGSLYFEVIPILLPTMIQELSKLTLLKMLTLAILLFFLLLAWSFYIYLECKIKLIPKFGVVWDNNKEPYCPICEKPLTKHPAKFDGKLITGVDCVKCKKSFTLMNDNAERITLIEAKKLL